MKRTHNILAPLQRNAALVLAAMLLAGLYLFRLTSITRGQLAPHEKSILQVSSSLHNIIDATFFLPLNVVRYVLLRFIPLSDVAALRLATVSAALLGLTAMLYITRRWYGQRTLLFGFVILASSAWWLHVGRLGVNDIAYLVAIPLLLAVNLLLHDYTERSVVFLLWLATLSSLLYVPGAFWLVLAALIWQREELKEAVGHAPFKIRVLASLFVIVLLAPLSYGFVQHLQLAFVLQWLGLPVQLPSWQAPLKDTAAAVLFIGVRSPRDASLWLGRLPVLDAFVLLSFIAGISFYFGHIRAERTKLLLLYTIIGLALCAAGSTPARNILVPLVQLVAFGGIAFLLHQWLKIFPRNPLARRLGIGLICLAIGLSAVYGLRQYFVAWPHNPAMRQTFAIQAS